MSAPTASLDLGGSADTPATSRAAPRQRSAGNLAVSRILPGSRSLQRVNLITDDATDQVNALIPGRVAASFNTLSRVPE
jgi:hypothetical protein